MTVGYHRLPDHRLATGQWMGGTQFSGKGFSKLVIGEMDIFPKNYNFQAFLSMVANGRQGSRGEPRVG